MTPRIYHDGELTQKVDISLSQQASHHLSKVLRARPGDSLILFNGDGNNYHAVLRTTGNKRSSAHIENVTACETESPLDITLLQGLSRNDRMDTTLQKTTELGVSTIVPVICERSKFRPDESRLEKKMLHWRNVIISACEQSSRCRIPKLLRPLTFEESLAHLDKRDGYLLSPDVSTRLSEQKPVSDRLTVVIGPESGFKDDELTLIKNTGCRTVSFGPRILRTETAGPAVIAAIQTLWGDTG